MGRRRLLRRVCTRQARRRGLPADCLRCCKANAISGTGSYTGAGQVLATTSNGTAYVDGGGACYTSAVILCSGNGHVALKYGSPEYLGLGLIVFVTLVFLEIFGSPFMRNAEVVIALLFGYLMAGVIKHDGNHYVSLSDVNKAPGITFLWVKRFHFGFYAPAVLPSLIGFLVTAVEAIGDITATEEASRLRTRGRDHRRRIQGGLMGDGGNCFFGALAFTLPSTTFAQNNGVIVLTRCGSRSAGVACGCWLILFGIISKIGAFFTSIPQCVLGGMTSFLFANVCVSGIKVITLGKLTRRTRFIVAVALAFGLGVTIEPDWATNNLWPVTSSMGSGLRGFRDSVILVLSNGFAIGCLVSIILHLIIPMDEDPIYGQDPDDEEPEPFRPEGLYDKTEKGMESGMRPRSSAIPMDAPDPKLGMGRNDTAHGTGNNSAMV